VQQEPAGASGLGGGESESTDGGVRNQGGAGASAEGGAAGSPAAGGTAVGGADGGAASGPSLACPAVGQVLLVPSGSDDSTENDRLLAIGEAFGCPFQQGDNPPSYMKLRRLQVTEPALFAGWNTYVASMPAWVNFALVPDCGTDGMLTADEAGLPAAWSHPSPYWELLQPGFYVFLTCEEGTVDYVVEAPPQGPDTNVDCAHAKPLSGLQPRVLDDKPRYFKLTTTEALADPDSPEPNNLYIQVDTSQTAATGNIKLTGSKTGYTVSDYAILHTDPTFYFNVPPDDYCIELKVPAGTRYDAHVTIPVP
jgi:hypothetical protein